MAKVKHYNTSQLNKDSITVEGPHGAGASQGSGSANGLILKTPIVGRRNLTMRDFVNVQWCA